MTIRIRVRRNNFVKVAVVLPTAVAGVVAKTALDIETGAKRDAPVLTGNLRRSYHTEMVSPYHAIIGTDVEYAPYVEFGTSRMAAQPHLTPAARNEQRSFEQALRAIVD